MINKTFFNINLGAFQRYTAFTIAEIIIVIGIIGIIAQITIPDLVANYQKAQTVTQLKEAYSLINQALTQSAMEQGADVSSLAAYDNDLMTTESREAITTNFVKTNIIPYVKINRDCGYDRTGGCSYLSSGTWSWNYMIHLANGTSLGFVPNNDGTKWQNMLISVDLNAMKNPNKMGKDIFALETVGGINHCRFRAEGHARTLLINDVNYGCNKSANGIFCGALIQQDGWKISDDYPWN